MLNSATPVMVAERSKPSGAPASPVMKIMLERLGSDERKRIRNRTGGVLLPTTAPFKVAEILRMLEVALPGAHRLGSGRRAGAGQRTARAVGGGHFREAEQSQQVGS